MRKLMLALLCAAQCLAALLPLRAVGAETASSAAGADAAAGAAAVVINEIHYDASPSARGAEYVELLNNSPTSIDLTGWSLARGIDYVFPAGATLPAGGYVLVTNRPADARAVYGVAAYGPYAGQLSTGGDGLLLRDRTGQTVDELAYQLGFPWPTPEDDRNQSIGLINAGLDNAVPGSWRSGAPTPGGPNNGVTADPPPFIADVSHSPQSPRSWEGVTVRARVQDADGVANVRLWLQGVLPGSYIRLTDEAYRTVWDAIPMQALGDGVYAAQVPESFRRHRMLVRYRIEAVDAGGRAVRVPFADDPQPNFAYFVYDGVPTWRGAIVANSGGDLGRVRDFDFTQMRSLPAYHLLAQHQDVVDSQFIPGTPYLEGYLGSDYPWQGTLVVGGVVYDHIGFRARGGAYRYSVGKNHWKFDFTRGHGFQAYDDYGQPYPGKWDKLNFSAVIQHAQRKMRGEQGMFESLAYRLFNLAGVPTSNTHFVHFRVIDEWHQSSDNQYEGDFWGLYLALENLDGNFLDERDLPDGNLYDMQAWSGELDNLGDTGVTDKSDLVSFMSAYTNGWPDARWWRSLFDLQGYYKFRSVLEAVHHYDVDQGKNYYYYLNPQSNKWSILPWDLDLTWSETMFGAGNEPFRDRVLANPAFQLEYQNELRSLRDLLFNQEQMFPLIDETAALINSPSDGRSMVDADRSLWDYNPILASWYVSDDRAVNGKFYESSPNLAFSGMLQLIKEYVQRRTQWIDRTLLTDRDHPNTPALAYTGAPGYPADGLRVSASAFGDPQGADTFAGMQWRAAEVIRPGLPGYAPNTRWRYEIEQTWLSPELKAYQAETVVPQGACRPGITCRVRVRMMDSSGRWSHWSAPLQFVAGAPAQGPTSELQVSEIMYKPAPASTLPGEELEFVELYNGGAELIDLSNMRFSEGIDYQFPAGAQLAPGAHLVLAGHAAYFTARYGFAPFAQYDKELSNQSDRLLLRDAFGATVLDVTYSDSGRWPQEADGQGPSLVAVGGDPNSPDGWRPSTLAGGSPGAADPLPVVVNEVQFDASAGRLAQVELYNPGGQDAAVGGWVLSTAASSLPASWDEAPAGLRLPAESVVPAGGYLVLDVTGAGAELGLQTPRLGLFSAGRQGRLSGYAHGARLAIPPAGTTVGRIRTSDGREHFAVQAAPSLGAANAGPLDPPVLISRVQANSTDGVQWVEIANATAAPVPLYDPARLDSHWQLDGLFYQFPGGVELGAGARLLVTSAEPSSVCLAGQVPPGVRVLGPLPLPLAANGMALTLTQPTPWGASVIAGALDQVYYRNEAPWPYQPADTALSRLTLGGFGSEPANWQAVSGSGFAGPDGSTPAPVDLAVASALCSFDAFVDEAGQMVVRWVAAPQAGTVAYRLLRAPLAAPESKTIVASPPADAAGSSLALAQLVDADADPRQQYVYWLQTVAADGSTRDVAWTTLRTGLHYAYAPLIAR